MRIELIRQGHSIGWQDEERKEACLNQDAPLSFEEELITEGYAVCVAHSFFPRRQA